MEVVLLTEPWVGTLSLLGIGFAVLSGIGVRPYIVITHHVGDRLAGVDGLAISLFVVLGAAVLLTLIPWTLELWALRRLKRKPHSGRSWHW